MLTFNYLYQKLNDIHIHSTGCDLSIYDARKFANTLPINEKAIVFNTCSVFAEREVENRLLIELLSTAFPEYKLYLLGCDITNNPQNYNQYSNLLYNNDNVSKIINKKFTKDEITTEDKTIYLKIQDGCRHKCTFCIINKLRNKPYSVSYKEIVDNLRLEIGNRKKVKVQVAGTELTNYYDKETGFKISDVLKNLINDVPEIEWLALTSIDPASDEVKNLIKLISKNKDKMIPHLNLAVQSGSDEILEKMKRRHNVERVRYIHQYAKKYNIGLGWDIIVGFPGETDDLFEETLNLIKELKPLTKTIFAYSPREGTPAYQMTNQVPDNIKQKRLEKVIKLINSFIYDNSIDDNIKDCYLSFVKEDLVNSDIKNRVNKTKLCEMVFNGYTEIVLDMFNINEFSKFIRNPNRNCILYVNYNIDKSLESNIYINFLKEYLRDILLVVYMPKNHNIDIEEFENHFHCIVIEK